LSSKYKGFLGISGGGDGSEIQPSPCLIYCFNYVIHLHVILDDVRPSGEGGILFAITWTIPGPCATVTMMVSGPYGSAEKGTRCVVRQIRGCPRNCKRRAKLNCHWDVPGRPAERRPASQETCHRC